MKLTVDTVVRKVKNVKILKRADIPSWIVSGQCAKCLFEFEDDTVTALKIDDGESEDVIFVHSDCVDR